MLDINHLIVNRLNYLNGALGSSRVDWR